MNWTALLNTNADMAYAAARGLVEVVDDAELAWEPSGGSNWLNTGQLIRHVTNACGRTAHGFVTGKWMEGDHGVSPDWKPSDTQRMPPARAYLSYTRDEALAALAKDHETFRAALAEAGEERLQSEQRKAPWGGPERALGAHLLTCIAHLETHKAQLFYYLKMQGRSVNTLTLWGM